MRFDPQIHRRRSIRLKGYDYSQDGAYFITIVIQGRECLCGEVINQAVKLTPAGEMILVWWQKIPRKFQAVSLDAFVLMPNHFHGVIMIDSEGDIEKNGQTHGSAPTDSRELVRADPRVRPNAPIAQMVQWFKTMTTNEYIRGVKELGWPPFIGKLWQRNYYEHIIRNPGEHARICNYIYSNPLRWMEENKNRGPRA